jgi:hypothetical protein
VLAAAASLLAAAAGTDDADGDMGGRADKVRDDLRAVLLRHLDEDLATEDVLLGVFRGRLPDG